MGTHKPRILHLAFEDYKKPGSGGGAIRTREINQRLATDFDITVLTSRYKGCKTRTENGVTYKHIGLRLGNFGSMLSYFAAIPFALFRHKADLIIEDFAAPISSMLLPLWTRRPHIAVVQWLNAREKSQQYHLPFWIFEYFGLKLHKNYIAVSNDLKAQIKAANPKAKVTVIGNGIDSELFNQPISENRKDILYIGRIERAQKGIDILLEAYAEIALTTSDKLLIAGDGNDVEWLKQRIIELKLEYQVILLGRLGGIEKANALSSAKVVAMPSRFETFGIVAVEALACGTPVVAFDIPCLREVVPTDLGSVVPTFEVSAYAKQLSQYIDSKNFNQEIARKRRDFALQYNWDDIAHTQADVFNNMIGH